ncbi:MAG: ABC transporter permease [Clostridia bacterium]|nr:ABC transporter permease [Clostridia bacterium]
MKRKRKDTHQLWFYPTRMLRRRPAVFLSCAAVLFCLFSLVSLSLFLAEGTWLQDIAAGNTGRYYAVLRNLDRGQMLTLTEMAPTLDAEYTAVPVYAHLEDIESRRALCGVTVLTGEVIEWYALDAGEGQMPKAGEILLPAWLSAKESYYRLGQTCHFFFHDAGKTEAELSVTRPLRFTGTAAANDTDLPYTFVTQETAEDILSAAEGEITYDVYFTTPIPSDYACALLIDTLLPALDWPADDGDPRERYTDDIQRRYRSESRRIRYQDFVNYDLLDLLNREYMDDPLFFFMILPVILAAALGTSTILLDDMEDHLHEYGLLKASGAGMKTLYGTLYTEAFLTLAAAAPAVLLSTFAIARPWLRQTHELLTAGGIAHRFGLPVGNLVTVFLYILLLTCLFLWLRARRLLTAVPGNLLKHTTADDTPEVRISAWEALNSPDPVRYMVKTVLHRERKRRRKGAFTQAFLMGVCGYMIVLQFTGGGGMEALYAVYLYGAYLILSVLGAFGELRQNRREYALLRQWGAPDAVVRRKAMLTRFYDTLQGLYVMGILFGILFILPALLSGWIFTGTPVSRFLLSTAYTKGVVFSALAAALLQIGNFGIGQLAMVIPVRRMLARNILEDLRRRI